MCSRTHGTGVERNRNAYSRSAGMRVAAGAQPGCPHQRPPELWVLSIPTPTSREAAGIARRASAGSVIASTVNSELRNVLLRSRVPLTKSAAPSQRQRGSAAGRQGGSEAARIHDARARTQ